MLARFAVFVLATCASGAAVAATPPPVQVVELVRAAAGWSAPVPAGLTAELQEPRHTSADPALPQRWLSQVTWRLAGAEVLRFEVFANPQHLRPEQWVELAWRSVVGTAVLRPLLANAAKQPALSTDLPRSPQRHAQRLVFMQMGSHLGHLVCHTGADPAVAAWCEAVLHGIAPAMAR